MRPVASLRLPIQFAPCSSYVVHLKTNTALTEEQALRRSLQRNLLAQRILLGSWLLLGGLALLALLWKVNW